jgi:hypothetical protein
MRVGVRYCARSPEVATSRGDLSGSFRSQGERNLVHVQVRLHALLLGKVADGEVLVPDHEADFALTGITSHHPEEAREQRACGNSERR